MVNQIEYQRDWHKKNPLKAREYTKNYRLKHPEKNKENNHKADKKRSKSLKRKEYQRIKVKEHKQRLKLEVLSHYSNGIPKCVCCGETILKFLTIDHVNNDGYKDRKLIGGGADLYRWLKKHNYPEGYQVMCYNCNIGKSHNNGICPHNSATFIKDDEITTNGLIKVHIDTKQVDGSE